MSKKAVKSTGNVKTAGARNSSKPAGENTRREDNTTHPHKADTVQPPSKDEDPTLGERLHPAERAKPGPDSPDREADDKDADGRPTAREGLRPVGREKPHPTAAARLGKTVGQVSGASPTAALEPRDRGDAAPIKVQATKMGYYDHTRRRVGDVFLINGEKDRDGNVIDFSKNWMVPVDSSVKVKVTTSPEALAQEAEAIKALKGQKGHSTASDPLGAD
jgi:hypothetical protein